MRRVAIAAVALLFISCDRRARIDVMNGSPVPLENVRVIATQVTVEVGGLPPGVKRTVFVCPNGESSLTLRFRANEAERVAAVDTYLECSTFYHVLLEIHPDLSASATNQSRKDTR